MKLRQLLQTTAKALWGRRYDLCLAVGAAAVAIGIGCIYWPAGVIGAGLGLSAWGIMGARTEAAERRRRAM